MVRPFPGHGAGRKRSHIHMQQLPAEIQEHVAHVILSAVRQVSICGDHNFCRSCGEHPVGLVIAKTYDRLILSNLLQPRLDLIPNSITAAVNEDQVGVLAGLQCFCYLVLVVLEPLGRIKLQVKGQLLSCPGDYGQIWVSNETCDFHNGLLLTFFLPQNLRLITFTSQIK
ncbi:MAG: hypothetical protein A4E44_01602 [Methanosaeta sp. PtaB.Bin018]|nr:MAG: hypothetical protein A4E44_01602 [Methanosaeta sp. PtaB.Bin018]